MEQQNVQVEEGISLVDIFKLLLRKVKILIIAVLIGGILGAAFAVFKTYNVNYYGAEISFYVNPKKDESSATGESQYGVYGAYGEHVMDNMVRLLGSEIFAEMLILNNQPLPEKDVWVNTSNQTEVDLKLNEKIDAAQIVVDEYTAKQVALDAVKTQRNEKNVELTEANEALEKAWLELYGQKAVESSTFDLAEYNTKIKTNPAYADCISAYTAKTGAEANLKVLDAKIKADSAEVKTAQKIADEQRKAALEAWRKTEKYKEELSLYMASLQYSYQKGNVDKSSSDNFARSFIYVDISVLTKKDFAEKLLAQVREIVPIYVENNMAVPSSYVGTNCQEITTINDIVLTNSSYTTKEAIKYGLLLAVAAFVIACAVVIIVDRSDKRLRDPDLIEKEFHIPLLGVIPSLTKNPPPPPAKRRKQQ